MERRVTPPRRVTSPTWGPPPLCKQALKTRVFIKQSNVKTKAIKSSLPRPTQALTVLLSRLEDLDISRQAEVSVYIILAHPSTMKGRVIIFSITGCPFCMRAKDKMQKLGIEYIDINLDNYPERRAEAKQRSGRNTVPQIFFNNRHIGGFDDFDKLVRDDFLLGLYCQVLKTTVRAYCRLWFQ